MASPHERLQQARERAGYSTASAAAQAFGWAGSTYLGHENGSRGMRPDAASRYARAFGVSWSWLLGKDEEDAGFGEVVQRLTPVPVTGVLDPGAFRNQPLSIDGAVRELYIDVFGYRSEELTAYAIHGARDFHFLIVAKQGTSSLYQGDELIVSRRDGEKAELAAWRLIPIGDKTGLQVAYASYLSSALEPLEMLDVPDTHIHGVVVGEFRVKRRVATARSADE